MSILWIIVILWDIKVFSLNEIFTKNIGQSISKLIFRLVGPSSMEVLQKTTFWGIFKHLLKSAATQSQKSNKIHFIHFQMFSKAVGHQDQITSYLIICSKFDRVLYVTGPCLLCHMRFPSPIVVRKVFHVFKFNEKQ